MKICCTCKKEKALTEFNKASKSKDGLQARCKPCARIHYLSTRESQISRVSARNIKHKKKLKQYFGN